MKALELLLDRQKAELKRAQSLLSEVEEQVKGVKATKDEVENMMRGDGEKKNVRSTTPDVERPVVESLTPPPTKEEVSKDVGMDTTQLNELAGLENLDPEIIALLKADMGLNQNTPANSNTHGAGDDENRYAP